ncbi:LysR family transcriptional regulator [Pseudomonas sp. NFR16]|uniref:LysR family transcriptional regulator n=1 Tax=Pseudomonas sp. NFR16 TaxID=1566248 RepID=UPI0008D3F7CF|nr:LysR family transcriptional regulator [Pseudomonas sp. NFR16]SEI42870.1 transcriptional regulator, LysR family [Pseudomonas sp. NFR16]
MDLLFAMKVFTRVVESNSFTRAADTLQIPKASATVIIQQLEAHLKIRLLQRTTRRLGLTPDGATYYERCVRILADIEDAEHTLVANAGTPRGTLRVDMPTSLGKLLVLPDLYEFHQRYPDIELLAGFGDRPVDLIQDSVDCVIRVGELPTSNMVARRIGLYRPVTVASPDYLARHGMPTTVGELKAHFAINYFWGRHGRLMNFSFTVDGQSVETLMHGNLAVNDTEVWMQSCLKGLGIIQAPRFMAAPYLASGELVEVLIAHVPPPMPISVVYPQNRHLSPTVRVFVDWIAQLFEHHPLLAE